MPGGASRCRRSGFCEPLAWKLEEPEPWGPPGDGRLGGGRVGRGRRSGVPGEGGLGWTGGELGVLQKGCAQDRVGKNWGSVQVSQVK